MKFNNFLSVSCLFIILLMNACDQDKSGEILSKSFEFRYVSSDTAANGITDFKGPTSVFDLDERMDYLAKFAHYGAGFFNDPGLNTRVVQQEMIDSALQTLKSQPKPNIRELIELDQWKYLGYKVGMHEIELQRVNDWDQMANAHVQDEALLLSEGEIVRPFRPQNWRMGFSWKLKPLEKKQDVTFSFSDAVQVGLSGDGSFFYVSDGDTTKYLTYQPGKFYHLKVEIDLESGRYNFFVNDDLLADFALLSENKQEIDRLTIKSSHEVILDDLWGVEYALGEKGSRTHPYFINTFMDENFSVPPSPEGFEQIAYNDSQWKEVPYKRYAHGGERHRDEVLYLRRKISIGDFETARLNIETVRPSAEIYINGTRIKEVGRVPETIDVSQVLKPGAENLIAVKVDPYAVDEVKHHMSTDRWSSWFAGLMELELTNESYINEVFAYTTDISDSATVQLKIKAVSENDKGFTGTLITQFHHWYPEESNQIAAQSIVDVRLEKGIQKTIDQSIGIKNPELWTTASPNLYKVRIVLLDPDGVALDDYVLTTGLRTIRQDGGTFRINGKPEVLFGPLVFNQPYPLENVSKWMFSPPESKWVETILECKKMNSNAIRMSVHDQRIAGVNDRRLAQIGDQMGIMFMWQTPAWIREGSIEDFDLDAVPKYMQSVQNNPSIVIWQPGNHPHEYPPEWYGRVLFHLSQHDPSRLISPAAALYHMGLEEHEWPGDNGSIIPGWTHPQLARGNMEQIPSYGRDWRAVREFGSGINKNVDVFNDSLRMEYLNSDTHAWFDYESEETIGMPNWELHKGKPYYHMYSYEKYYNEGNIGRGLEFSEWKESQAWQALSGYETYRKKRWLDYDGMNWCPLRGGPNTATYMKPVIEYSGEAKLAFYALQMVYQRVLAGSKNVDIVYGPDDEVPVIVMNLDESKTVDVQILVKTIEGKIVAQKDYDDVVLEGGRTVTELGSWKPELEPEKYYGFEYYVKY